MIEALFTYTGVIGIFGVFLLKIYNLAGMGKRYEPIWIFIGWAVGLLCFLLVMFSFYGTILQETTTADVNGVTTATEATNDYVVYSMYNQLAGLMIGVITILSVAEVLLMFNRDQIRPWKSGR